MKDLIEKYRKSKNRLLLLDYDGTLVQFSSIPINALPSEELLDTLIKLDNNKYTKVVIISGRSSNDMDKLLGKLSIMMIAEHGAMIKSFNMWNCFAAESDLWKKSVIAVLEEVMRDCSGSYIENKRFSLNWDYRSSDPESGSLKSREIISKLEDGGLLQLYDLKIHAGSKNVEILPQRIGKGHAVLEFINQNTYDYIISIGDEATDEEMFEVLRDNPDAYTIKVGEGPTCAKYRLKDVAEVDSLLKNLSLCD
jgi:trehalose 6-phosphate synthase/phosphatase